MKLTLLLLTILLVSQSQSFKYGKYSDLLNQVKTLQNEIIVGVVTSSNPYCKRCDQAEDPLIEFYKKANGMIKINILDCELEKKRVGFEKLQQVCGDHNLMPHITFFEQNRNDGAQWPKDHIYTGAVDHHHFLTYIEGLTHNEVKMLDSSRKLRNFMENKGKNLKVLFFTEEEETRLTMKIASVQNRDQILFGQVDSDSKLAKQFPNRTKTRQILFLTYNRNTKQYDETWYEDSTDDYKAVNKFLQKQIQNSKVKAKQTEQETTQKMTEIISLKVNDFNIDSIKDEQWVLYHLYEPGKVHPKFEQVKDHFGAFFKIYSSEITCGKCKSFAQENLGITTYPNLIIYPQGGKNKRNYITVSESEDLEDLAKSLLEYTKATEKLLYNDDEKHNEGLYKRVLDGGRIPIVFYYDSLDNTQKLFMHSLTYQPKYKKILKFFRLPDPDQETKTKWETIQRDIPDSLPQIFTMLEVDDKGIQKATAMTELDKTYLNMALFLDSMNDGKLNNSSRQRDVIDVNLEGTWDNECRSGNDPCLIAMLSVHKTARYTRELEMYKALKDNFPKKKIKWVQMDGYCRDEILTSAGLTTNDLPTLIYYDNNKGKYKTMEGKFTQKNMENFVTSLRRKNSVYSEVKNEFEIGKRDCKIFNEKQTQIYEEQKQKLREEKVAKERANKEVYDKLPVDYDEYEDDDNLDNFGMRRERRDIERDEL